MRGQRPFTETKADDFNLLTRHAKDVLPEGQLKTQLAESKKSQKPLRIKLGIDPTAPDIHLGHAVVLKQLRRFQDLGHTVVLIIGDYTSKVGDPTGRDATRPVLTKEQITKNGAAYSEQVLRILDPSRTEIRRNSEWLEMPNTQLLELLKEATVSQLLERDDFKKRIDNNQPISVLEMIYPILQGYDSVEVEADVEVGATEQLFNLLQGRNLQIKRNKPPQSILTMPILVGTDGQRKMGKSANNYIGLNDSPEDIYGKTMSIPDSATESWMELLLDDKIKRAHPMEQKRALARGLVEWLYNADAAAAAEEHFNRLHKEKKAPQQLPECVLREEETYLPKVISEMFSLTRSEARRLIDQGAVSIDKETVKDYNLSKAELDGKTLKAGKRRYVKLTADFESK
jgi:tyrosyl-tRNA synthetase